MAFPVSDLPSELGVKELAPEEAVEVLVAQAVRGRVAPGRQRGYDVYRSELYPDKTFQIKYANVRDIPGKKKKIGDRDVVVRPRKQWAFSVNNSDYKADWYILFGERDGRVYPFLLSYEEWIDRSSKTAKGRFLLVTAQEYSRCGRYASAKKRNRTWEYYVPEWTELPKYILQK